MTKAGPFPPIPDAPRRRSLVPFIAGVALSALVLACAALLTLGGATPLGWTGFAIGTLFGLSAFIAGALIALPRS